jgi:Gas vesicle synthesis protein GvpL/GvpF
VGDEESALKALRAAIQAFGEEAAPEVVSQAREEALERATSVLADAMTHSVLEHARPHLADEPRRRPTTRPPRDEPRREAPRAATRQRPDEELADDELAYYVYGVARTGAISSSSGLEQVTGVAQNHHPRTIDHEGLTAIVSMVPLSEFGEDQLHENLNDVQWLERKARAHETVLDEALSLATVVPLRLCTIYRSDAQVREMLDREREVFEDALHRLEGKTEWGVKMIAEPRALVRALSSEADPEPAEGLSEGAEYMRQKSRQARAREEADLLAEEWAERVHTRVAAVAVEALLNPLQNPEVSGHTGDMLLNGVYLVDDADADAFREEVARLADEFADLGAAVELTGPWPPYNFVKGSIEAAR